MKKLTNKKGFTLAELLVVVAIIAVLVAVSIPVFGTQLEKAKDATSVANLRAAYAEASAAYLTGEASGNATVSGSKVTVSGVVIESSDTNYGTAGDNLPFTFTAVAKGTYTLEFTFPENGTGKATATVKE